jgi:primosomal protein N' (replication factor Y) (superfamily II helicase)
MTFAEVIIFKKVGDFDDILSYRVPEAMEPCILVGCFVEIPFRNARRNGMVVGLSSSLPAGLDPEKVRDLSSVLSTPPLPERQVGIARFVAGYYHTTLCRALKLFLPLALWEGKVLEPRRIFVKSVPEQSPKVRGPKAQKILETLTSSGGLLPLEGLREQCGGFAMASYRRLLELGAVTEISEPLYTPFSSDGLPAPEFSKPLTADQERALQVLRGSDRPTLLHGVTGSGKTELYLHLIRETAFRGKQSILLVPEIALTPQTIDYFRRLFGDSIALFHSRLSNGERLHMWWKARSGSAPLIIGSRSAIFAPVTNLGLIILDEEHEWTYKQESAPYYRTHRIAEEMAKAWGAHLVFGSATPSAESYQKTKMGEYTLATLSDRIQQTEMPQIHLIDLREEFKKRNFSIFSLLLQNKIRERLERKEQVILFVNQRGLANAVVCRDCGFTEQCPRCDIALKYHRSYEIRNPNLRNPKNFEIQNSKSEKISNHNSQISNGDSLVCHYCQFTKAPELLCPHCHSAHIKHMGVGTQRVEEEVHKLFPTARVARADRDTTSDKDGFEPIYRDFLELKTDILIGTQMVAKGLDFGNVTLIGIVLADVGLHQPDFRSSERLYQILTQVSGRCGRRGERGEVVLQTYNPTHPTIRRAAEQNYSDFIESELKHRAAFGYPPFGRMIKFTVTGTDAVQLSKHIEAESQTLEDVAALNQLPIHITSAPASIPKISDRFHYHVLIRADRPEILLDHWKIPRGWRIDVDPVHTT